MIQIENDELAKKNEEKLMRSIKASGPPEKE
jgi:hypothetical protein